MINNLVIEGQITKMPIPFNNSAYKYIFYMVNKHIRYDAKMKRIEKDYHWRVMLNKNPAEAMIKYLKCGSKVIVEGSVYYWENMEKDLKKLYKYPFIAGSKITYMGVKDKTIPESSKNPIPDKIYDILENMLD